MADRPTVLVFFFLFFFVAVQSSPPRHSSETVAKFATKLGSFAQDFYKAVNDANPGKNLIMSPFSAETAFALLSLGAKGETQQQMQRAMYMDDSEYIRASFKPAMKKLNSLDKVTLKIANKVYVKEGSKYTLNEEFNNDAKDVFNAETENVDFLQQSQCANTINGWIEHKTNSKIKNVVNSDWFDDDTRLVLVNAVYFKGSWRKKFKKEHTRKKDFLCSDGKQKVDMMHNIGDYSYAEVPEWDAKVLEMPYEGHGVSMVIALPNKADGVSDLENKLISKEANMKETLKSLYQAEVDVTIPKFRIETSINLKNTMSKLGMTKVFGQSAELEGCLASKEELFVSQAVQKAFIEVNEEGAEAAASSVVMASARTAKMKVFSKFVADHPFVFMITVEKKPLFIGKFIAP